MAVSPAERALQVFCGHLEKLHFRAMITDREGNIEYVNPTFERVTGYSKSEAIGKTPRILKSGKHSQRFYTEFWNILLDGNSFRARFINKKKDGTLYSSIQLIVPVMDDQRDIRYFVSIGMVSADVVGVADELRELQTVSLSVPTVIANQDDAERMTKTVVAAMLKELEGWR